MTSDSRLLRSVAALVAGALLASVAGAQTVSTFTYQGELQDGGSPAIGTYDFQFRLFDDAGQGTQVGPTLCRDNISVAGGRFTTALDFGAVFAGQRLFLEIAVRVDTGSGCNSSAGFTTLGPRQEVTASPYASFAVSSASAQSAATAQTAASATNALAFNGQPASFYLARANQVGVLPSSALGGAYGTAVSFSNAGNTFSGAFAGNGSGLTQLNAGNLSVGLVVPARGGTGADTSGATSGQVLKFGAGVWVPGADNDTTYTAGQGLALTGTTFSLALQGAAVGQVLKFNGAGWVPAVDANTTYTFGAGLANNLNTISIPTGGVTGAMVLDNTLTAVDIAPSAITSSELASDVASLAKVSGGIAQVSGGNIGIGGAAPAGQKLHVLGNFNVQGAVTVSAGVNANSVTVSPTSRTMSISPIAFLAASFSTVLNGEVNVSDTSVSMASAAGTDGNAQAAVNLPNGATVTGVFAHIEDDQDTDVSVFLLRRGLDGSAGGTMASVTSSGNAAATRVFSDASISAPVIDNTAFSYSVRIDFHPTVLHPTTPQVHGIRIVYSVTSPLP